MDETEYVSVGFSLRWGEMRFLRAQADVFDNPKAVFDLVASGYPEVMTDDSPVTGNGIAVGEGLDVGTLWFRAPVSMHKVGTHHGFLYSVSKADDGFTSAIHFGFPSLLRDCCVAGVWSIVGMRMDRVRTLTHRFGDFRTAELSEKALKYRIDKL